MIGNYCVGFFDLLGQREALRAQSLLPQPKSPAEETAWVDTVKRSIGAIGSLHSRASGMLAARSNNQSGLRSSLPPEQQRLWDQMSAEKVRTQRWSDGLLCFSALKDSEVRCQMNGVFRLFGLAGTLCLMGLASKQPLRGALEIAWAAELYPGELYGAAVARAYELESEKAGYPRIVVGPQLLQFLSLHSANDQMDPFSRNDQSLAKLCLEMLVQDADGTWMLHYLGQTFQECISAEAHADLYEMAQDFIADELRRHAQNQNEKLRSRYALLARYFHDHTPLVAS